MADLRGLRGWWRPGSVVGTTRRGGMDRQAANVCRWDTYVAVDL
jgi:hypothetical protein